ncbi:anaerobic sulfatase maturase [Shimwellia blattae]|uniref:Radical SAM domain protein n=1 Tax=Shimwellia blattae (strain ATCC 29907 / DSM 4481 / JCM 1650 / NBRC 105725 / CDC 9005-74) TaxID=630626 RepID=I2B3T9_SHIBC|nr:anaerobic sulfatase maturase [Shimwellia blattae]AFJ45193.1 radical SAM domain protein [Shimwellia blattae DSM 4481 = NBRC 105725]GAB80692.1 sulfatase-maturating enzyme homolog AslB [Shimwellia blattae DSM 4481 = NBRC 105725]VDY62672.1 Anaerobic sulfatase-maturating enzyme homolog YdeM [Shimwellia blattae]VEC19410.1 Anaerobic sulfatase-maturating enzyme homolog YdeM [Shimwellia blattae]
MHITAKPTSYQCNLQCDYCFYLDKEAQFTHSPHMDAHTLEAFIRNYIDSAGPEVYFTWQGGEPTLAGLDFYRNVIALQQKFAGNKKIHNAMQTNGILLNDEWCRFLRQHNFLMGISIDGPEELHNRYRVTRSGKGTFEKVMAAIELLKKHQVEFNTLTVINNYNVHYPLKVYEFLKSIGSRHMQFIELLETSEPNVYFDNPADTFRLIDFSVPAKDYGHFMATIFKAWVKTDVGHIFVRQFESTISQVLGHGHTSCIFQQACHNNFVVESNGDVYECDHFVWPEYKIGNVASDPLSRLDSTRLTAQKQVLSRECQQCIYKPLCHGGCPKHRINKGTGANISYFCQGYQVMFATMVPYLNAFVELAKHRIPLDNIMKIQGSITPPS